MGVTVKSSSRPQPTANILLAIKRQFPPDFVAFSNWIQKGKEMATIFFSSLNKFYASTNGLCQIQRLYWNLIWKLKIIGSLDYEKCLLLCLVGTCVWCTLHALQCHFYSRFHFNFHSCVYPLITHREVAFMKKYERFYYDEINLESS